MTEIVGTSRDWLRCYRPRPAAVVRLICLPHASGNASFYRVWLTRLPPSVELVAVQYPGRLDRVGEPCLQDMDSMADALTAVLRPLLSRPVALFGHSMGAAIAYEVAHRLEHRHGARLARLFVSGCPAPRHHRGGVKHLSDDEVLWGEIRRLGGTAAGVLDYPELRTALLPVLRADYQLVETYRPTLGPPLASPVTALSGDTDPEARVDEVADWRDHTQGDFTLKIYPGDHFYLLPHIDSVVAELTGALTR